MKVVHIQLRAPYTDNWGYQENILPRCQARQGDFVTIIAQNKKHINTGEIVDTDTGSYRLSDGVNVIRISSQKTFFSKKIDNLLGTYKYLDILEQLAPDVIFVHGMYTSILSADQLIKYKRKHKKCVIFADTHAYGYDAESKTSLIKTISKTLERMAINKEIRIYNNIFGITPACIEYAQREYKIKREKLQLLPLGFDPQICDIQKIKEVRKYIRGKYGIQDNEIVIIHGGKIIPRRRTQDAIYTVGKIREYNGNVRLVIFGDISEEIYDEIHKLISENNDYVLYLGHLSQQDYNDWFLASDVAFFPGAQSVLWQEAIGCGLPLVICKGEDLDYLNTGGNAVFFRGGDIDSMVDTLKGVVEHDKYIHMKKIAIQEGRQHFSYEAMANKISKMAEDS